MTENSYYGFQKADYLKKFGKNSHVQLDGKFILYFSN